MRLIKAEDLQPGDVYETPQLRTFVAHRVVVQEQACRWAWAVTVMNKGQSDLRFPIGQPLHLLQRQGDKSLT